MPFADDLIRPLHDPRAYREAALRSWPRSLLHVARLALVAAIAATTVATLWLSSVWSEHVRPVIDSIPTITIKGGVARIEGPEPWVRRVVRDQAGHDWLVVLDTTGRTTDLAKGERGLLLLRTELKIKSAEDRVDTVPLSRFGDLQLGPRTLRRALLWRLMLLPPAILVVALLWFFIVKAAQALLLAAWLGRLGRGRRDHALSFRARLGVSTRALTAPVLFDCASRFLPIPSLLSSLIYFVLAALYAAAGERQLPDDA